MTKLVRKLKQMAKKRSHRKAVQKRRVERAQMEFEEKNSAAARNIEDEVDREIARLNGEETGAVDGSEGVREDEVDAATRNAVRVVGDLVLDAPKRKNRKQLSRKQAKRKEKTIERGEAINDTLAKKFDRKKRRVKVRAQIRNQDLHN